MSEWGKWSDLIECPYCGEKDQDSWEHNGDDGKVIFCISCDKPMSLEVDFDVKYATKKLDKKASDL